MSALIDDLRLPAKAYTLGVRVWFDATYDATRRFTVHIEGWGICRR